MNPIYYKLPLDFSSVFIEDGKKMKICNEVESIDQYIELLLTTCPGEHRFNKQFGCRIWNLDFESVVSRKEWEGSFVDYVSEAVLTFEKRLKDVKVSISVNDVARKDYGLQTTAIKKEVIIMIESRLISNDEPCKFRYVLYLGPLSIT
jgi:phage baseplate assembly protein W